MPLQAATCLPRSSEIGIALADAPIHAGISQLNIVEFHSPVASYVLFHVQVGNRSGSSVGWVHPKMA